VLAAILLAGRALGQSEHWAARAVTSRLFVGHALVVLGSGVILIWLGKALSLLGEGRRRRRKARPAGEEGAVMLEFALVLPIAMMLILAIAQSAMLMVGTFCVHYAAYCAARSAAVYVPDDLADTSGEDANYVDDDPMHSFKMQRVHDAAVWAVLPVSASTHLVSPGDAGEMTQGIDILFGRYDKDTPLWVDRLLARKLTYAQDHTFVQIDPPADGSDEFAPNEDMQVWVRHTFYMSVPFAGRLFALMDKDGVKLDFGARRYGVDMVASCHMTNEGEHDNIELEEYPFKLPPPPWNVGDPADDDDFSLDD
jgi:hypothetical protein